MSTIKRFTIQPNLGEPIAFEIASPEGEVLGVFHVPNKPRLDIVIGLSQAVVLRNGTRQTDPTTSLYVLRELMCTEMRNADGIWEPCDDRDRFDELLASQRWVVDWEAVGDIIVHLTEQFSAHPTGASSLS